ncbi:MAG: ABC transporter ATP-binding protein [bacterium]|nr:MAG: ABC transporter ATP-binding protein [bacterium]
MVEVRDIEKSFGDKVVLNKLSFSISPNDVYGLLGPNGAGKTTTINILCNLLDADSGMISIEGKPVSEATKHLVGIVPQEVSIYQDLTIKENLLFFAKIYGIQGSASTERADELIHALNLHVYENIKVSSLSGGWRRRVNIAVALVHSPSILILDEPTAGLDIEARYELWELIKNLKNSGVSILLTTHQLEEAERLCSCIGILQKGRIVAEGSLDKLRELIPAQQIAVIETEDEHSLCQKALSFGWEYRHHGSRLILLIHEKYILKDLIKKLDDIPLTSISLQEVGLEHIYLELTQE